MLCVQKLSAAAPMTFQAAPAAADELGPSALPGGAAFDINAYLKAKESEHKGGLFDD